MIDIADLESRLKKAQIRAEKAKSAYESAANEAVRLETTLSVVREIIGVSDAPNVSGGSLSAKQKILVNSLKYGENNAMSPIDIYAIASSNPSFNGDINYVRTTLWRMANKHSIGSANGTYWRFDDSLRTQPPSPYSSEAFVMSDEQAGEPDINQWDSDLDEDSPF